MSHGYLRAPNGNVTPFEAPGAGSGSGQGTMTGFIDCINPEGAMTGYVGDASNVFHGYLRTPDGNITNVRRSRCGHYRFWFRHIPLDS